MSGRGNPKTHSALFWGILLVTFGLLGCSRNESERPIVIARNNAFCYRLQIHGFKAHQMEWLRTVLNLINTPPATPGSRGAAWPFTVHPEEPAADGTGERLLASIEFMAFANPQVKAALPAFLESRARLAKEGLSELSRYREDYDRLERSVLVQFGASRTEFCDRGK